VSTELRLTNLVVCMVKQLKGSQTAFV
jgi:hypothetical protein